MKQEHIILKNEEEQLSEISDDIEIVGPGRMLKEARKIKGLSQQQVADKLNFRISLVENIEVEQFDLSLPSAFNRGYLKSYAKLVNISQEDINWGVHSVNVLKCKAFLKVLKNKLSTIC